MSQTEILLIVNSSLMALVSILLAVIAFFFRDLHRQFKLVIDRVNQLHNQLTDHATRIELHRESFGGEVSELKRRMDRLETDYYQQT